MTSTRPSTTPTTTPPSPPRRSDTTSGSRATPTGGCRAPARRGAGAAPERAVVRLARSLPRRRLPAAGLFEQRVRPPGRVRHGALHAARHRPERRRRLGRIARPGLRRVLRDGRVCLRAARLGPYGIHMWSIASIPIIVVLGGVVGLLSGLPSRRLSGDYLAIVTLFFLQLFETVATNGDQFLFGAATSPAGRTGSCGSTPSTSSVMTWPSSTRASSPSATTTSPSAFFAVVFVALHFVNQSRTGRAWRSQREDPLAAEVMGMPVNWLKLMASPSARRSLRDRHALRRAQRQRVSADLLFVLLITVYTMVILGGRAARRASCSARSSISVLLELLREPGPRTHALLPRSRLGLLVTFRFSNRLPSSRGRRSGSGSPPRDRGRDPPLVGVGDRGAWATRLGHRPDPPRVVARPRRVRGADRGVLVPDHAARVGATGRCSCRCSTSPRSSGRT